MPKCTKGYTRLTLETCYNDGEVITVSSTTNRNDLSVDELAEHIRGVLLASSYSPQSVDSILPVD